jgi:aspartate 1-decarboxylase
MSEAEADVFKPKLVYFDAENRITHTCNTIAVQMKEAS